MPNSEKNLFQVRLSEAEGRFIRSLAAGQGMTHQQAVVAAFTAWADKLKAPSLAAETPALNQLRRNRTSQKHPLKTIRPDLLPRIGSKRQRSSIGPGAQR